MPPAQRSNASPSSLPVHVSEKPEHSGTADSPESSSIAVLSDIHSNLHALKAVLDECSSRGIRRFYCLGDIVGYGAFPAECLHTIRSLQCPTVMGNHDESVAMGNPSLDLNYMARAGVFYSIEHLDKTAREWLASRPPVIVEGPATLVHASLADPLEWDYVTEESEAKDSLSRQRTPVCFYGHTHVPKLFTMKGKPTAKEEGDSRYRLDPAGRYMINPGSVGQPRGGDPRAQFIVFDPSELTVEFVRVPYDIAAASDAILAADLPTMLAERLHLGL